MKCHYFSSLALNAPANSIPMSAGVRYVPALRTLGVPVQSFPLKICQYPSPLMMHESILGVTYFEISLTADVHECAGISLVLVLGKGLQSAVRHYLQKIENNLPAPEAQKSKRFPEAVVDLDEFLPVRPLINYL